jgi:hypothetical protein
VTPQYWLLDLEFGGQTLRLASADLDVTSDDGPIHYEGVLQDVQMSSEIKMLDASLNQSSVSIDAVLPADVPALIARGYPLEGCSGTLALWREGTAYEARRVVMVGAVRDPEYGAVDEPVSFTLEDELWQSEAQIPALGLDVNGDTWPDSWTATYPGDASAFFNAYIGSLTPEDVGLPYPVVFGYPGRTTGLTYPAHEGSIAVHVTRDRGGLDADGYEGPYVVIAGHRVNAQTVYAYTESVSNDTWSFNAASLPVGLDGNGFAIEHWTDALGNVVAVLVGHATGDASAGSTTVNGVTVSTLGSDDVAFPLNDESYRSSSDGNGGTLYIPIYVGWYDRTRTDEGGGMIGDDGQVVRGAGDVLTYLLRQTGLPVDAGRCAAAASLLNGYKIDCAIDARVAVWEWLQSNLLPILPVSIATGAAGLYPVVWRYDAIAADARFALDADADPTIIRASRVKIDSSKVANRFRLNFCVNRRTGEPMQFRGLDAAYDASNTSVRASYICAVSQARYKTARDSGIRDDETTTGIIWDVATADAILATRARAYALAQRTVDYVVSGEDYDDLQLGDVVTLSHAEIGMTQQVAIVTKLEYDASGSTGVGLLLIEDPARDLRRA